MACLGSFHFPEDVRLDNAFKVEQKVKYKSDLGITGWYVQRKISRCAAAKGTVILKWQFLSSSSSFPVF